MSGKIRNILIMLIVGSGSIVAVRSLEASPAEPALEDPPISLAAAKPGEVEDTALAESIHRFAALARLQKPEMAR
jgi:hypothetical protein